MRRFLLCILFLTGLLPNTFSAPQQWDQNPASKLFDPLTELLSRTIWPECYQTLFQQPYDVLLFWYYPMDVPFDHSNPGTYYGRNDHDQPYALSVRAIYDLGPDGDYPGMTIWGVDCDIQSTIAFLQTRGTVIDIHDGNMNVSIFLPTSWFRHFPPDYGTGRDCTPPAPPSCDPLPDCEWGAKKYLDTDCADTVGGNFTISCKTAWGIYDNAMRAAETTYQNCSDTAFRTYGICMGAAIAGGWKTLFISTLVGTLLCTAHLNNELQKCDDAWSVATTLAWDNRNTALSAATAKFDIDIKNCCKDCPTAKKIQSAQSGSNTRRLP